MQKISRNLLLNIKGNKSEISELKRILENNMTNGVLSVPKEYGMFVCKN